MGQYQTSKRREPNQERIAQEERARPLRFSGMVLWSRAL